MSAVKQPPLDANDRGEAAKRYRYRDGGGDVGLIASVTQPFCGDCTLGGASDGEILDALAAIWRVRSDRYSICRRSRCRTSAGMPEAGRQLT